MSEKKKDKFHRFTQEEINALPGRELKSKRTRSSKTYSLGNGLYQAVIYPEAIHYRNEQGEWEDIDHTLTRENGAFCDHSGDLSVKLAAGGCVTLEKNDHTLSWQIRGAASVEAVPENANFKFPRHDKKLRTENKVTYSNIFPNVDFVCDLKPNQFKDTLIFKKPEALCPVEFLIHAENLVLRQAASGAVVAMCGDDTIFRLPAPCVVDEFGDAVPDSAHAVLTQISACEWCWTCEVSTDYAATAAYPIRLDPVVETEQTTAAMSMAYTSSKKPTTNYPATGYSTLIANNDYSLGKVCTYLRFEDDALPVIDPSYYVTAATLNMRTVDGTATSSTAVYLKEVKEAWAQNAVTYDTRPDVADEAVEYYMAPTSSGFYLYFNIANLVRKWYNGENNGIMLETTAGKLVKLGGAGATYHKPYVTITYVSLAGLESYLVQDSIACGRAGTAHIGLFNGNLVFSHQETVMNGNLMPVSISRYYNSCYRDQNPFGVGYGWKLSTQQTLHKETIDSTVYYVYMDGDGTRHHFKKTSGKWKDMSGLELTLTLDPASGTAAITNKTDGKMVFALPTAEFDNDYSNVGMLQSVADACGNTATFTHNASRIFTAVTDGANRTTSGACTGGILTSITAPGMPAVSYAYTSGRLMRITHVDGAVTAYSYDENGLLETVTNHDGSSMKLIYQSKEPFRVREVHLYGTEGKRYSGRKYTYGNCCTKVTELYPDAVGTLKEGKSLYYHFNDAGNLVSVNDELGYGYFAGYSDDAPLNHPSFVSKMQRSVNNYLKNHHFITVNSDWVADTMDGSGECGYNSENNYIGGRTYRLKKTSSAGRISTRQTVTLKKGRAYTLSAQYKTLSGAKAQLRIEWKNSSGAANFAESPAFASTSRWNRAVVSFMLPADAASADVVVRLMAAGGTGSVWFDAVQLEDGLVPNRYNLLENGSFYMNDSGRPMYWSTGYAADTEDIDGVTTEIAPGRPSELTGNVVRLYGKPGKTKIIDQTIPSIGNAGDTFVAGGWSWSNCRPRNNDDNSRYEMEILARPYVNSGIAQFQTVGRVQWSEEWSGWQFAAIPVVIPFRYTDIYVKLMYQNNLNEAQFSNLFLHKEEFGKTYAYDDKGNVTSVKNLASLQSGAAYDDFDNLISYHQPGRNEKYTLDWGSSDAEKKKHLLRTTKSPLKITQRTEYDASAKGLPVASYTENSTDKFFIASKTEYTKDQNYVARTTDARGKAVNTVTDGHRGTVTSVTDPKGQSVNYTYDVLGRVTEVKAEAAGKTYRNVYTYTDDKLTKVAHNTTESACDVEYTFEYDKQNRRTKVKVGSQVLSEDVYNNTPGEHYGTLSEVKFGNHKSGDDNILRYKYDGFKRPLSMQYGEGDSKKFSFEYGANGQVALVTNHELNRTVLSECDSCSRPMRATHMEGSKHIYTGEVTYDGQSNVARFEEQVGDNRTRYSTTFSYDVENKPTLLKYDDANKVAYAYDSLGRTEKRTVTVGGTACETSYEYAAGGQAHDTDATKTSTTGLVESIKQTGGNFAYKYDDNGNIISVVQDGKKTSYAYDALGQLIRVDDEQENATWVYTYDQGGNILSKKKYALGVTYGTPVESKAFTYGNANWKDQLTAVNGKPITYDAIGNPESDGTWTYTWEKGRQLASMHNSEKDVRFKYNENGLRIEKVLNSGTANEEVTNYTLYGKNIVHMTQGSNTLHFFYDAQNKPAVVVFNGTPYSYVKNLQGDIVAILDSSKKVVVSYVYDAWGRPIKKEGSLASTLGTVQPFRYRGYVYDEETGLYYLRNRYFNTMMLRFVNFDSVLLKKENFSLNGYVYCSNNPIYFSDAFGTCVTCSYCNECGSEHLLFSGEARDKMKHVVKTNYKKCRMKVCQFMALLEQMLIEEWQYDHDTAYGFVDCVGVYRYSMYWYYSGSSTKALMISNNVEGTYRNAVYNKTNPKENVVGKGEIDEDTEFTIGMGLFRNPLDDDGHFAVYVGDWFAGYENAVVESVYGGVTIRELSESEAINGPFTHYGYMKGIDYTD